MPKAFDPKQIQQAGATDGQVLAWDNAAGEWVPKDVNSVITGAGYCLWFGGDAVNTGEQGKYFLVNGKGSDALQASQAGMTRAEIPISGEMTVLAINSPSGAADTYFKIYKNGVLEDTVQIGGAERAVAISNSGGVSAEDYVEVEYDAGTAPGEVLFCIFVDTSTD